MSGSGGIGNSHRINRLHGRMNLGRLSIAMVLAIAAIKSGLVLGYFMHLRYETGLLFKLMIRLFWQP